MAVIDAFLLFLLVNIMLLKPNEEKKTMLLLAVIEVPLNRAFSMSFVTNFDTGSVQIATRYTWSTNIEVPFLAEYLAKRKI